MLTDAVVMITSFLLYELFMACTYYLMMIHELLVSSAIVRMLSIRPRSHGHFLGLQMALFHCLVYPVFIAEYVNFMCCFKGIFYVGFKVMLRNWKS